MGVRYYSTDFDSLDFTAYREHRHDRSIRNRRALRDHHHRPTRRPATRSTAPPRGCSPTRFVASTRRDDLDVAILTGAANTFCAGADLKAVSTRPRQSGRPRRRRPDGTDAHAARQTRHRRGRRSRRRGRTRTGAVVRSARRRARRGIRRVLPPLGRAVDRRRHHPPAAADRPQPRARSDPHRPRRLRRRSKSDGPRESARRSRATRSTPRSNSRTSSAASRSAVCAATDCRRIGNGRSISTRRCAKRRGSAAKSSAPEKPRQVRAGSPRAPADMGISRRSNGSIESPVRPPPAAQQSRQFGRRPRRITQQRGGDRAFARSVHSRQRTARIQPMVEHQPRPQRAARVAATPRRFATFPREQNGRTRVIERADGLANPEFVGLRPPLPPVRSRRAARRAVRR